MSHFVTYLWNNSHKFTSDTCMGTTSPKLLHKSCVARVELATSSWQVQCPNITLTLHIMSLPEEQMLHVNIHLEFTRWRHNASSQLHNKHRQLHQTQWCRSCWERSVQSCMWNCVLEFKKSILSTVSNKSLIIHRRKVKTTCKLFKNR